MKVIISLVVGLITFLGVFYLDSLFINWIISELPKSAGEWFGIIKVVLWFFAFCWTIGIALVLATLIGGLVRAILD